MVYGAACNKRENKILLNLFIVAIDKCGRKRWEKIHMNKPRPAIGAQVCLGKTPGFNWSVRLDGAYPALSHQPSYPQTKCFSKKTLYMLQIGPVALSSRGHKNFYHRITQLQKEQNKMGGGSRE